MKGVVGWGGCGEGEKKQGKREKFPLPLNTIFYGWGWGVDVFYYGKKELLWGKGGGGQEG